MSQVCQECGAKCCTYFCFEIDEPTSYDDFENLRWYLCHEGVSIHVDEGDWFIDLKNQCRMLNDEGRCMIYDERPLICRSYSMDSCDHTDDDYGYEHQFHTPQEIEAYAKKKLGKTRYMRQKEKALTKFKQKAGKPKTRQKEGRILNMRSVNIDD